MKVFILHHHLDQGGVTKVIHSQIKSYKNRNLNPITMSGRSLTTNDPLFNDFPCLICKELDYFQFNQESKEDLQKKIQTILSFLKNNIQPSDILHIHNLNLGKNPLLNIAISLLLKEGYQVVNHCHDFAEDIRLNLFQQLQKIIVEIFNLNLFEILYPQKENFIYLTINSRDFKILKYDLKLKEKVKLLPNPIEKKFTPLESQQKLNIKKALKIPSDHSLIVYPVRAIRRKNIGELLLLSILYNNKTTWLITQPPKNNLEQPQYLSWKKLAKNLLLPIIFNAGEKVDFHDIFYSSDAIVTTSIMEGFGMAFLESWILDKPLIGRDIPSLTQDFKEKDIHLDHLYHHIKIPIHWGFDLNYFILKYNNYLKKTYAKMNLTLKHNCYSILKKDTTWIDFALLDFNSQKKVIHLIAKDVTKKKELIDLNQFSTTLNLKMPCIRKNKQQILKHFDLDSYGNSLQKIYSQLTSNSSSKSTTKQRENSFTWSQHFISDNRFYLILQ